MTRFIGSVDSVLADIEVRPVAVTFRCPRCHAWQRIDYDEFLGREGELWDGELEVTCENCGNAVRLEGCRWDV